MRRRRLHRAEIWEPPSDITDLLPDGARVLGESLKLGCHDGEISLSGRAENFTRSIARGAQRLLRASRWTNSNRAC